MKNTITVSVSTIPGKVILPHLLSKILQRNPDIALKLIVNNSLCRHKLNSMRNMMQGNGGGMMGGNWDSMQQMHNQMYQNGGMDEMHRQMSEFDGMGAMPNGCINAAACTTRSGQDWLNRWARPLKT